MRVLLINPPIDNMITTNIPTYVDEERGYNPPLGIMYIAAYAEKYTDHTIEILDVLAEELDYKRVEEEVRKRKPDVVGITSMTFTLIDVIKIAKMIKKVNHEIKIVLGGPHVYIYQNETIDIPEIDFLVLGEGEITFTELIQKIDNYNDLKNIKGLVFKHEGKIINTGQRDFIEDLDSIPFPARHLTKIELYKSLLAKRSNVTTMMTTRGCPYKCIFCDRPHLGKVFRARSAENVVREMEECTKMGINEFILYDDTFTINRQRVLDICKLIEDKGLDIGWDIRARVNTVDKEMLIKLKHAGCERIHYGVESANPEILKLLNKGITISQVEKAFEMTKEAGIETLAYFMIGSPTETRDKILNTINFAKQLKPDYVHFSITTPFPATQLYYMGMEQGVFEKDYWKEFAINPSGEFIPQPWDAVLSREELVDLLEYAYKSFYIRPSYILKKMMKVRSAGEFVRKAKAGLKLLK
jgi:anaerobic magnesium-protoporphyrin IX monomethyl ester cyclase